MSYNIKRRAVYYFGKTIRVIRPKEDINNADYVRHLNLEQLPDSVVERVYQVIYDATTEKEEPPAAVSSGNNN